MRCQTVRSGPRAARRFTPPTADDPCASHPRGKTRCATLAGALRYSLVIVASTALLAAYANDAAHAQSRQVAFDEESAGDAHQIIAVLRRSTARYHDLAAALDDGFVLLHECENRPSEGPVGTVYVHLG